MKYTFLTFFILLFVSIGILAQDGHKNSSFNRIENLERIKLMEALKMNEETSVRFFARRMEHKKKLRELDKQSDEILYKIKRTLQDKPDKNSSELKKLSEEYFKLQYQIPKERCNFYSSLGDILSEEQIARLLVFEKNFRDEIKNFIIKDRFKDRK